MRAPILESLWLDDNHAGLFPTLELEKPVDTSGEIIDSGDPSLDSLVKNALEMIDKLATSERVE